MKKNFFWNLTSSILILVMLLGATGSNGKVSAAPEAKGLADFSGPQVTSASFVGISQPLSSMAALRLSEGEPVIPENVPDRRDLPKTLGNLPTNGFDSSIVQNSLPSPNMPATQANFEGINNVNGLLPPDTNGDVGFNPVTGIKYYVQWVNVSLKIWNVTNPAAPTTLVGPVAGNSLWSGTGTICDTNNDGDPIVLFDHLANRWMISQFALGFPNNFHECIAVSTSADPTGTWYLYDFKTSSTFMNDYPKLGVWPDGYYMSVNQFNGTSQNWGGAAVAVFERTAMVSGLPARMIYLDLGQKSKSYGNLLPADLDGAGPTAGTPNYFIEWDDSAWLGDAADTLRIWEFKTDWSNPSNTTFGLNANYDPNFKISTANIDPSMCNNVRNCIPQKGVTAKVDAIAGQLMHRLQFRNSAGTYSLVGNQTVDATGTDQAGVYWFELRNSGSGWSMNQQGTFAPADGENRWMGSAAMDYAGNIALGYSVSGLATYPSIRYTGRLASDAPGSMAQGEATLIAGGGSQTHTAARWGDYSMMSVDPMDDCTFWYTQEYYAATSNAGWQTRIGSFKFPSCSTQPTGTLQGTITSSVGGVTIADATVSVPAGYSTLTNAAGFYQLFLPAGSYAVTASKYGFLNSTTPGVSVTAGNTTTQNIAITPSGSFTVSGTVKDTSTGWPLYSRIDIAGYPAGSIYTNPTTGAFSINLATGTYLLSASSLIPGYIDSSQSIIVSGNTSRNFSLNADLVNCFAPGYALSGGTTQNFESWPLSDWTIINNKPGTMQWGLNTTWAMANYTGGSGLAASANSDSYGVGIYDTELRSPVYNPASLANLIVHYQANYQNFSIYDALDLDISTNGGTTWTNISHWISDHGTLKGAGVKAVQDISAYATGPFQLRWRYYTSQINAWDWYAQIDDVSLGAVCSAAASTGLVIGAIKDANTNTDILNISVKDASLNQATIIDASADLASADKQLYVIAEHAGTQAITANAAGFGSLTRSPLVVTGDTVRQNFLLPTGRLSAAPTSLTFNVPLYAPSASHTVNIANSVTDQGTYEVFAVMGAAPAAPVPTGPFAANTRHVGPKNLGDKDARDLRVDLTPLNVGLLASGNVLGSWDSGLPTTWGIGFNTTATDLWVGNPDRSMDYRFLPTGFTNGDKIDLSSWVTSWSADMTYNPFTKSIWQVNVGGDNCVYELNPASKISTGIKICPDSGTEERGLAFDPLSNTYYTGSWTDGIINHFAPSGALLDSKDVGLSISGLAFNPSTGHLFAMTNFASSTNPLKYDVYVLDTKNAYTILGGFNLQQGGTNVFADFEQAGLEIDCSGNLWAVNQGNHKVYKAASGETGVCNWQLASWLSATPNPSNVVNGGSVPLSVNVDVTGLKFLTSYAAHLRITTDTPYGNLVVPVTLNVGQTFADVPASYWANNFIQRLYWNGVTAGCNPSPLSYCPEANVTRAQMAVFLLRAKHGKDYLPPAASGTIFTDVPIGAFAASWIEELKAEGITSGCSASTYCPNEMITRAQMAVFLLRAKYGTSYNPPPASGSMFTDVPQTAFAAAWIEQLKTEGITDGCGVNLFCPGEPVTRAQMAVFLVRDFTLP